MANELVLKTNVEIIPGKIVVKGLPEIREEIKKIAETFKVVISEDQVKDAKKDAAKLNKLAKALDDKRKEVKKAYEAPLKEFETQMKELVAEIKEARAFLDSQIKKYEAERKEVIKDKIAEYIKALYELHAVPEEYQILEPEKYTKLTAISKSGNITKTTALEIENDLNKILLQIQEDKQKELEEKAKIEEIKKEAIEEFIKKQGPQTSNLSGKVVWEIVYEVKADVDMDKVLLAEKTKELICSGKIKPKLRIKGDAQ